MTQPADGLSDAEKAIRVAMGGLAPVERRTPESGSETRDISPEAVSRRFVESVLETDADGLRAMTPELGAAESATSRRLHLISGFPGGVEAYRAILTDKAGSEAGNSERPVTGSRVEGNRSGGLKKD